MVKLVEHMTVSGPLTSVYQPLKASTRMLWQLADRAHPESLALVSCEAIVFVI